MAVQGFLLAFEKIDTDHDRIISHEDLKTYATDYNMPDAFIKVRSITIKYLTTIVENHTNKY